MKKKVWMWGMGKVLFIVLVLLMAQTQAQAQVQNTIEQVRREDKVLLVRYIQRLKELPDFSGTGLGLGAQVWGSVQGASRAFTMEYGQLNVLLQNTSTQNFQISRNTNWESLLFATYQAMRKSFTSRFYISLFHVAFSHAFLIRKAKGYHLNRKLYELLVLKNFLKYQFSNFQKYPVENIFDLACYTVGSGFGYTLQTGDGDKNEIARIIYTILTANTPEKIKRAYLEYGKRVFPELGGDPIRYIMDAR